MSVVGIDFGTLNSVLAVIRRGGVDVVCNEVSDRATPSMVSFDSKRRNLGDAARTLLVGNFRNSVLNVPQLVGLSASSTLFQREKGFSACDLVQSADDVAVAQVNYLGKESHFAGVELAGMLFKKFKRIVDADCKSDCRQCVVTVPPYFDAKQRGAIIDAAKIAGLTCLRVINDTLAIAVCYAMSKALELTDEPKVVCFVDVGYASSKVCIAKISRSAVEILVTETDPTVGGRDMDEALTGHLRDAIKKKFGGFDIYQNKKALIRVRVACERVKKILSGVPLAKVDLDALVDGEDFSLPIERALLETLVAPLLDRIKSMIHSCIAKSGLTLEGISSCEIVGGTSRIPSVKNAISEALLGVGIFATLNQEEAIARGAAFLAALESPSMRSRPLAITEKSICSLRVSLSSGNAVVVFPAGTALSAEFDSSLGQVSLPSTAQVDSCFELAGFNQAIPLGELHLGSSSSTVPVYTSVKLDINHIPRLSCSLITEDSVTELAAEFMPKRTSAKTLEAMIKDEAQMDAVDKAAFELDHERNAFEELIYDTRGKLDGGSWESLCTEAQRSSILSKLGEYESWLMDLDEEKKEDFTKRIKEIKAMVKPMEDILKEREAKSMAQNQLLAIINSIFQEPIREDLVAEAQVANAWLDAAAKAVDAPQFSSQAITAKAIQLSERFKAVKEELKSKASSTPEPSKSSATESSTEIPDLAMD